MNNKVAIYIRYNKSVEKMQLEEVVNYAKKNNLDLYKIYIDISSGILPNPPELTKLINESRNFDKLLIHSIDRISRNIKYFYDVKNKLYKNNVKIISVKENLLIWE